MKRLSFFFLIFSLIFSNIKAQILSDEQQEVWKTSNEIYGKWSEGDIKTFSSLIHENYSGWSNTDSLPIGKAAMVERFQKVVQSGKITILLRKPVKVTVTGNSAVVDYLFLYHVESTDVTKKSKSELKGKNAEFYIRENGKWMLLGDMTDFQVRKIQ